MNKKAKKISLIILICVLIMITIGSTIMFVSCVPKLKTYISEKMLEVFQTIRINKLDSIYNDDKVGRETTEAFYTALINSDKDALKALFSKQALEDCDNPNEQIDNLINRFGGKIEKWRQTVDSSGTGKISYGEWEWSKIFPQSIFASVDKGIHNKTTKYGLPTY